MAQGISAEWRDQSGKLVRLLHFYRTKVKGSCTRKITSKYDGRIL